MKKKFKFQRENGHLFEGNFEIAIKDHIAEIEESDIDTAVSLVIEANGGEEITIASELPTVKIKPRKGKKEVSK